MRQSSTVCIYSANLKYDKNMEQSLIKLIHFWEWSVINSWRFTEKSN